MEGSYKGYSGDLKRSLSKPSKKRRKRGPQPDSPILMARLKFIARCIEKGLAHFEILDACKEKFGFSKTKTNNLIHRVYQEWKDTHSKLALYDIYLRARKARLKIISEAWKKKDLKLVLMAEDSLAKLDGLFSEKVEHSGRITHSLTVKEMADLARGKRGTGSTRFHQADSN